MTDTDRDRLASLHLSALHGAIMHLHHPDDGEINIAYLTAQMQAALRHFDAYTVAMPRVQYRTPDSRSVCLRCGAPYEDTAP